MLKAASDAKSAAAAEAERRKKAAAEAAAARAKAAEEAAAAREALRKERQAARLAAREARDAARRQRGAGRGDAAGGSVSPTGFTRTVRLGPREPAPAAPAILTLDDLFRKTKTEPPLYYLPRPAAEVERERRFQARHGPPRPLVRWIDEE